MGSTLSVGPVTRDIGGETILLQLSSNEAREIRLRSLSDDQNGELKIHSLQYYNGSETLNLLGRDLMTGVDSQNRALIFNVENTNQFAISAKDLNCQTACLEVRAEANHSSSVKLIVDLKASDDSIYLQGIELGSRT